MKEIRQVIKSNGIKISGSICHPDEISGHHPFLLILHGIPSPEGRKLSVQEKGYLEICKQFCDGGFITTIFNLQGCKGSEGQYSPLNWVGNVKSILDHVLSSESNIDQDKVGILAFSAGAMISPYFIARDDRPKFLVCAAAPTDVSAESPFLERLVLGILMTFPEQKLNAREIKQELAQIDPLVHVKKIKIPILIIHGEHDELIPPEHSRKLYQVANEPKTLMILPKGTHKLHRDPNALKTIQEWIQKQIDAKI